VFERFTRDARAVVITTQDVCLDLGADEVRPVHLLLALTEHDSGARDLLAAHGVTADAVSAALGAPRPVPPGPVGDDDAAALRSLGIDLEAIREAVERQFGEGAFDAAAAASAADNRADADDDVESARARTGFGGG
jgi:ClpA/ClpB-like protein